MAKLSDLVPALANVLQLPERTVAVYARFLREARLLSTGGRGPGAANMTPDDCARLLIAIMVADQVKDAVAAVERFWSLPVEFLDTRETRPKAERKEWMPLPEGLFFLKEPKSFGETIAGLIDAARDGALGASLYQIAIPFLHVQVERRLTTANVTLTGSSDGLIPDKQLLVVRYAPAKNILHKLSEAAGHYEGGDAMVSFAVTQRTILALGELIRTEGGSA